MRDSQESKQQNNKQQMHANSNGVWTKDKIKQFGTEIESTLKNCSYDERVQWITQKKEEANVLFKQQKHDEAVDAYMQALCGFNF